LSWADPTKKINPKNIIFPKNPMQVEGSLDNPGSTDTADGQPVEAHVFIEGFPKNISPGFSNHFMGQLLNSMGISDGVFVLASKYEQGNTLRATVRSADEADLLVAVSRVTALIDSHPAKTYRIHVPEEVGALLSESTKRQWETSEDTVVIHINPGDYILESQQAIAKYPLPDLSRACSRFLKDLGGTRQ
jgi:hypothetical protein